jgi:hypothetical protein
MTLRLSGDTSGFTEIKAADAAGDNSIKLPAANGGANQLLQNGGTAGELQYTSAGGGLRYDSSGRLLVGLSSSSQIASQILQGSSFGASDPGILYLARGTATPANSQTIGSIRFSDNTHSPSAVITGARDGGTWSSISKPAYLSFQTTPDGSTSGKERVRITSDGSLKLMADCPGIDFSATQTNAAAMTSETLDSYEEGDWEPALYTASGSHPTYTLNNNYSSYTKVGRLVFFNADIYLTITSVGTGNMYFSLPFSPAVNTEAEQYAGGGMGRATTLFNFDQYKLTWYYNGSTAGAPMFQHGTNGAETHVTASNFVTGGQKRLCVAGLYYAAT